MNKILLLLLLFPYALLAQENEQDFEIELSGFVRGDYWYETRQNYGACEELFTLYPKPEKLDSEGNDVNAESVANMTAIATRLRTVVTGPEILGANSMGYVEADFTSNQGTDGFRFRHAFIKLDWENLSVLLGRYWHPMFVTDVFPTVMALNTGAPFQVFNRSPQLRFKYQIGNFRMVSALVYQGDYASFGPSEDGMTTSADYMKNAGFPEFNMRLEFLSDGNVMGVGGSYKIIQPRLVTQSASGIYKTNETVSGSLIMSYLKVTSGKFSYKYRVMLGQNVSEHLLLGGYAVSEYDQARGGEKYTPYQHLFMWGNIVYGSQLRVGLFGGFAKNLGTADPISGDSWVATYARGANIDYTYRIAPHLQYSIKNLDVGIEAEYTAAAYGEIDFDNRNEVKNAEEISNLRVLLTAVYSF